MFNFIFDGKLGEILAPLQPSNQLFLSIQHHRHNELRQLLSTMSNHEIATLCDGGMYAVHVACKFNNMPALEWLLEKGASIEQSDVQGNKPLHYASKYGSVDVCKLLVERGSSSLAAARNVHKQTPYDVTENHVVRQYLLPLQLKCEREQEESLLAASGGTIGLVSAPPVYFQGQINAPISSSSSSNHGVLFTNNSQATLTSSSSSDGGKDSYTYGGNRTTSSSSIATNRPIHSYAPPAPPAHLSTAPPSSTLLALAAETAPITPTASSGLYSDTNSNHSSNSSMGSIGRTAAIGTSSSGSMVNINPNPISMDRDQPVVSRSSSNDSHNNYIVSNRHDSTDEGVVATDIKAGNTNPTSAQHTSAERCGLFGSAPSSAVSTNPAPKIARPTISSASISFPDPSPTLRNTTTIVAGSTPALAVPVATMPLPPPSTAAPLPPSSSQYEQRHLVNPPPIFPPPAMNILQSASVAQQPSSRPLPASSTATAAIPSARIIRPDGFHSSASDPVLQQRYGHIKETINIAPPPIFSAPAPSAQQSTPWGAHSLASGGPPVQQYSAFGGHASAGGGVPVYNRYPVYEAHTNSVYAPPSISFSAPNPNPHSVHSSGVFTAQPGTGVSLQPPAYRQQQLTPQLFPLRAAVGNVPPLSASMHSTPPHPSNVHASLASPMEDVTAIDASSSALM